MEYCALLNACPLHTAEVVVLHVVVKLVFPVTNGPSGPFLSVESDGIAAIACVFDVLRGCTLMLRIVTPGFRGTLPENSIGAPLWNW